MAQPHFEVVPDDDEIATPEAEKKDHQAALSLLMLGVKTVSQRAVAAIADLFFLATVFSAFYLWSVIPDPNVFQVVALTIYAVFILAANVIVRRK